MSIKHTICFLLIPFFVSAFTSCTSDDKESAPDPIIGYWKQGGLEINLGIVAPTEHQSSAVNYLTDNYAGVVNQSYLRFHDNGACSDNNREMNYIVKGSSLYLDPIFKPAAGDNKSSIPATEEYTIVLEDNNNKLKLERTISPALVLKYLEEEGMNMEGVDITSASVVRIFRRDILYTD